MNVCAYTTHAITYTLFYSEFQLLRFWIVPFFCIRRVNLTCRIYWHSTYKKCNQSNQSEKFPHQLWWVLWVCFSLLRRYYSIAFHLDSEGFCPRKKICIFLSLWHHTWNCYMDRKRKRQNWKEEREKAKSYSKRKGERKIRGEMEMRETMSENLHGNEMRPEMRIKWNFIVAHHSK